MSSRSNNDIRLAVLSGGFATAGGVLGKYGMDVTVVDSLVGRIIMILFVKIPFPRGGAAAQQLRLLVNVKSACKHYNKLSPRRASAGRRHARVEPAGQVPAAGGDDHEQHPGLHHVRQVAGCLGLVPALHDHKLERQLLLLAPRAAAAVAIGHVRPSRDNDDDDVFACCCTRHRLGDTGYAAVRRDDLAVLVVWHISGASWLAAHLQRAANDDYERSQLQQPRRRRRRLDSCQCAAPQQARLGGGLLLAAMRRDTTTCIYTL
ncbi:unnamed protein product [Trichogramma brassicae]|uniref:Uncharacterized protein n=1 Tax=Trichogramma brassicae TaxID=86971 RepID=A0A6H5IY49_9HYME|nr:unnamed protein product [Trichogramma brassicae]